MTEDPSDIPVLVSDNHVRPVTKFPFFISFCFVDAEESFLTRGLVCSLQLLLDLIRAVIHGSEFRGLVPILYCHRLLKPKGPGSCIYIHQEQGSPVTPPRNGCGQLPESSEIHVTTDSLLPCEKNPTVKSPSLSWCPATVWDKWPDLYYYRTLADFLWGTLPDKRTGL
jgi:hypothetical protein